MALQRTVGNHAVGRLLSGQRRPSRDDGRKSPPLPLQASTTPVDVPPTKLSAADPRLLENDVRGRAAANRAIGAWLQREVHTEKTPPTVSFKAGNEIGTGLAQAATAAVADGRLDDAELEALRQAALAGDETVSDDERMFIAALLDAANRAKLRAHPLEKAGDELEVAMTSITAANRARVANLDRPKLPADIAAEEGMKARAFRGGDAVGLVEHSLALERAAIADASRLAGRFAPVIRAALLLGQPAGVPAATVVRAMIAAASDSTEGDLAMAGAVYVIAQLTAPPLAADVLAGHLKVDEVPRVTLGEDWAAYQATGSERKGDTIYLPSEFDPGNLGHRSAVVHELTHAEDDKTAAGPAVVTGDRLRGELKAYRRQARFLLDTIAPLTGPERESAVRQAASVSQGLLVAAMALEARTDLAEYETVVRAINNATTHPLSRPDLNAALTANPAAVERAWLQLLERAFPQTRIKQDGFRGESILDWITRPGAIEL